MCTSPMCTTLSFPATRPAFPLLTFFRVATPKVSIRGTMQGRPGGFHKQGVCDTLCTSGNHTFVSDCNTHTSSHRHQRRTIYSRDLDPLAGEYHLIARNTCFSFPQSHRHTHSEQGCCTLVLTAPWSLRGYEIKVRYVAYLLPERPHAVHSRLGVAVYPGTDDAHT